MTTSTLGNTVPNVTSRVMGKRLQVVSDGKTVFLRDYATKSEATADQETATQIARAAWIERHPEWVSARIDCGFSV